MKLKHKHKYEYFQVTDILECNKFLKDFLP